MTRSGGLSDISGSLPFGRGPHYPAHYRLTAAVARPAARTIFCMLASDGGAPAPRRPAARTTRAITGSPRPSHDPGSHHFFVCSPRTVWPQPHDVLRLALPAPLQARLSVE